MIKETASRFSTKVVSLLTLFLFVTLNIQCTQGQLAKPGDACDAKYPYCLSRTRQLYCDEGVCRCHYHEEWDETAQSCRLIDGKLGCESQADCLTGFECDKTANTDLYGECHNPNALSSEEESEHKPEQGNELEEGQPPNEEPNAEGSDTQTLVTEHPPVEHPEETAPPEEQASTEPNEAVPEEEEASATEQSEPVATEA